MTAPSFAMVALMIEDLPPSIAFYRRVGVEFPADAEGRTSVQVPIGGDHMLVLSTTFAENDPDRQTPSGGSRIALEFFVGSREAVDAKYAELTAAGYRGRRAPWLTNFDAYMCLVDDPDGNMVLVTAE
jgi:hypothetical protein